MYVIDCLADSERDPPATASEFTHIKPRQLLGQLEEDNFSRQLLVGIVSAHMEG